MKNLSIMYHYVRDNSGLKAFTTKQFTDQLAYLVKRYRIVALSEFLNNDYKEDTCILTFDDGLKDGHANCLPILEKFGIKAVFFIPTSILVKKRVFIAQKRALLLAKIGTQELVDEFNRLVPDYLKVFKSKALDEYNDPLTSNLKYMIDYMDFETSEKVMDTIFSKYFDEDNVFEEMYLNRKEIIDLRKRGMDIGAHGHNHRWLGNLYIKDQYIDLKTSVDVFKSEFNMHPRFMSYPFGSQNFITHRLLSHLGFEAGLLDPTSAVKEPGPFEINRYDCIDIIDGEVPNIMNRVTVK